jgi:hypothetical protein
MIIKLDWFSCNPTPKWEALIHQMLEEMATLKQISLASVRVEEMAESSKRYHLTTILRMPGPDVLAHGDGHTVEEALTKMADKIRHTLQVRAANSRKQDGAARGVKATHRG